MTKKQSGRAGGQRSSPRQVQRDPQQQRAERLSMAQRAEEIIKSVARQRPAIEAVLPTNIGFDRFQATLTTALRHNPDILNCTTASIVQACCKAAYDGLALDGREAALVPQNVKISRRGEPDLWEKQARYNPMVYGLIKQMVDSGLVADAHATLVYEGEHYRAIRGTEERIEHEEIPEKRGPGKKIRAVYCVARLTNGLVKFETMSKADVDAVRAMAATTYVWDKNEGEMTRKTVIRRLRKSIAGGRDVRDAEMLTMFPHFQADTPAALPAPPKPDRRDYQPQDPAQLEQAGPSVFFDFDQKTGEVFQEEEARPKKAAAAKTKEKVGDDQDQHDAGRQKGAGRAEGGVPAEGEREGGNGGARDGGGSGDRDDGGDRQHSDAGRGTAAYKPAFPVPAEIPSSMDEWRDYADRLIEFGLPKLKNVDQINAERQAHQDMIDQAPGDIGDRLADAFQSALTDLV